MSVDGPSDSDGSDRPPRTYWERVKPPILELSTIDSPNGQHTIYSIANYDRAGWYKTEAAPGDVVEDGFGEVGAPWLPSEDYDALTASCERVLYTTVNYQLAESLRGTPFRRDGGWEWDGGENPLPDYEDMIAVAPFADVDLRDEYKVRPLDASAQGIVERVIEEYVDEFADLAGGRDAVFALDSVGGVYIFAAPATTVSIGARFGDDLDPRRRVFEAYRERLNEWLHDAERRVYDAVDGAEEILKLDAVNHKNRLFKAPLSPHADIDGAVTPIDTDDPRYDVTPISAVDDQLVESTREWTEAFTDPNFKDRAEAVIETLWPEYSAEADGWEAALRKWVENEREREREREQEERRRAGEERLEDRDVDLSDQPITTSFQDIKDAIAAIDIKSLAKQHCKEWEPTQRDDHFDPGRSLWKDSD